MTSFIENRNRERRVSVKRKDQPYKGKDASLMDKTLEAAEANGALNTGGGPGAELRRGK